MASSTKLHSATLVTNIKTCVPIQLDDEGTNFNTWVTLFKLHCRAHLVDIHILPDDSTKASVSKDSEWQRLDDIVRTWIYCTISPSLLTSIIRPDDSAFDAWTRIENNFQNNKSSRILHLESKFNDISLANFPNVKAYCNELENLATSLNNLGSSISDNRLALQVLHGLTTDYRTFRSLVQHISPIPSFDTLRSMLELEEHSHHKETFSSHDSALITTPKPSSIENSKNFEPRDTSNHHGGHRHHRRGGRSSRSPSHRTNPHHGQQYRPSRTTQFSRPTKSSPSSFPSWNPVALPYWAQPPCSFPTQPWAHQKMHTPSHNRLPSAGLLGPRPAQSFHATNSSSPGYFPTDIDQAMHTLSLSSPDEQYYMDTGATSHMT
ncbi:uncharacterized protein LOC130803685 [Amaranthus tricolor]|uniref:uncharacterized protein LOC130803685 n=1 Tax=Amaranthus tricolor TaxID=29722 RepID=UPI002582DC20|nr:uncharacterized protein LOC130803685 [Amaranthus tricolor]